MTGRLWREEGLLVGGSSGTVVAAALRVAARPDVKGAVVALLGDGWDRYRTQPWMRRLSGRQERQRPMCQQRQWNADERGLSGLTRIRKRK